MTADLRAPFLVARALAIPTETPEADRTVYDDGRMMNVTVGGGTPVHTILTAGEQGGTRKTGVARETTDDS